MAAVFQELVLTWGGKEYRVTPTMRLINQIENHVSLSGIYNRTVNGDPPFSHIATAISMFLAAAGCKATDQEVYMEITQMDYDALSEMMAAIMLSAFPWAGKGEAPATPSPKQKSAKGRK